MARLTQEQVDDAANAIMAEGQEPTLRLIQSRIGSGSYTTIKVMLKIWQQNQVPAPDVPIPDTIAGRGHNLIRVVWSEACRLANERVQEIEQAGQREREAIRSELELAEQTIAQMEKENERLSVQFADVQGRAATSERERNEAVMQAQVATARTGELEQQRDDLRSQVASAEIQLRELGSLQEIRELMVAQASSFDELARNAGRRKMMAERERAE